MEVTSTPPLIKDEITFAWWNTSLAPSAKSRATPEIIKFAASILHHLVDKQAADFIALGEVSEGDLKSLAGSEQLSGYKFVTATTAAGKSSFDLGFFYNPSKMTIQESTPITTTSGTRTLKIAQRVKLSVVGCNTIIHIFISHWPSRMYTSANDSTRHQLGIRLRTKVDEILDAGPKPLIVLIGDFNDEPFDLSMSEQLQASRDWALVNRRKHLLYNPFWSYLGRMHSQKQSAGSYYHRSGTVTRWLTFDQIIFSHGFVSAEAWGLQTECEHIVHIPELLAAVTDQKSFFDHLPVYGTIERTA